jgi:hypothetical protein
MTIGTIDYASSYFKYKTPTPIRGEPTHKSLKRLKLELQANASSVETDLGGGNHGYLGLVLTDEEYALIPNTQPFIAPNYPPPLVIPANTTQIQALELKEQHEEEKRLYLECRNVEKALLRHIQDALEERYSGPLVDEFTNLLTGDVPSILEYFFYNYGQVRSEEVTQKEQEVMSMSWQPNDPIVLLTRPIEQLQKLATQAGIPYTDSQILEKGLTKIRATRDFEYALTQWENKPQVEKTWTNFKTHFHEAQLQLKQIRGPTMQQSGFHHANALAQELTSKVEEHLSMRDSQLLSVIQSIPGLVAASSSSDSEDSPPQHTANSISIDNVQLEILKLLKELKTDIKRGNGQPKHKPKPGPYLKTPDDATKERWRTNRYCWTHGGCGHTSDKCNSKAEGHKNEANFNNKMGGSKAYCS